MTWARYDDMLALNSKVSWLRAQGRDGLAALGLHLLVNTWSRHEGAGGLIPGYVVEQLGGRHGQKLAGLLGQCGMFDDTEEGWRIHDYDKYSERGQAETSAAERRADLSEKRAAAGRIGGSKRGSKPEATSRATEKQTPSPVPEPLPCLDTPPTTTTSHCDLLAAVAVVQATVRIEFDHAWRKGAVTHAGPWKDQVTANRWEDYGPALSAALADNALLTPYELAAIVLNGHAQRQDILDLLEAEA